MTESNYTNTNRPNQKVFTSLNSKNIKKRFNIWQQDNKTGTVVASHLSHPDNLEQAIAFSQEFQEFSNRYEKGKFTYKVDLEIIVEDSEGNSLMEDGDIAYSITIFPQVEDYLDKVEVC